MSRPSAHRPSDWPDVHEDEHDFLLVVDDVAPHRWTRPVFGRFRDWLLWRVLGACPAERFLEVIQRLRNARRQRNLVQAALKKARARIRELEAERAYR